MADDGDPLHAEERGATVGRVVELPENAGHVGTLQHFGRAQLAAGWNRVLVKVENGAGGFGLYFRVLDDRVRAATDPG